MSHLETYLRELAELQSPGVPETSGYGPLRNLLNAVGDSIKPKVRCIINLQNVGAGIPDGGLAERRIVEMNQPGHGVVCFISNYSWLDGLSHTGMRERYLEAFDKISIDCLNGDKHKTGKLTPEGKPDPSVFSTPTNREGIQVGTAITLLVRKPEHQPAHEVEFRNLWGKNKRADLLVSLDGGLRYEHLQPSLDLGLPFIPLEVREDYPNWMPVDDLFRYSSFGFLTNRDDALVSIDREPLVARMGRYFDPDVTDAQIGKESPPLMRKTGRFDPIQTRATLLSGSSRTGETVRLLYRPFDVRWLYWHPETKLVEEKRADFRPHIFPGNLLLAIVRQNRKGFTEPLVSSVFPSHHLIERGANYFPLYLHTVKQAQTLLDEAGTKPNLSDGAVGYLAKIGGTPEDLFFHTLAVLHAPEYRVENGGALRQDWPRVPLPAGRAALTASADLGRAIAALLDTERQVPGVTEGTVLPELKDHAVFSVPKGRPLNEDADFAVTAGWGNAGKGGICMPGKGKVVEREGAFDIYLNESACWRNVPVPVWEYTLGGIRS